MLLEKIIFTCNQDIMHQGFNKVEIPSNALSGFNFKNKLNADTTIPLAGSLALTGGKSFSVGENSRLSFFLLQLHLEMNMDISPV